MQSRCSTKWATTPQGNTWIWTKDRSICSRLLYHWAISPYICVHQESNPGHQYGKLICYHYTMDAWLVFNKMHLSGIGPEAFAWKANMLPLHHRCYASTRNRTSISWLTTRDTIRYTIEAVFPAGLEPATLTVLGWCHYQLDQGNIRQLQDLNLCGQRPIDFKSISLTTRTSCLSLTTG